MGIIYTRKYRKKSNRSLEIEEELKHRSKEMKKTPTVYEKSFADRLKKNKIYYKPQFVIGRYIVDFLLGYKVIVEIDGDSHLELDQIDYDRKRTQYFNSMGYKVIRIDNAGVNEFNIERLIKAMRNNQNKQPKRRIVQENKKTPNKLITKEQFLSRKERILS
jgi:very-short-patch-repair endonuclease